MVPFISLRLDRSSPAPLQRQLYSEIRDAVLAHRLAPGARLPSTRALAADLGLSRNTVAGAFDQLLAEGYIEGRAGAGTFVMEARFDSGRKPAPARTPVLQPSQRGRMLAAIPVSPARRLDMAAAFRPGVPALDEFPRELWSRITSRVLRSAPAGLLNYGDPAGYRPLRKAIAEYLRAARGVHCTAGQVIVTAGSQQALDLAARVLLDPGETAWMEDPGYVGARGALQAASLEWAPIPVDEEGLSIAAGEKRAPRARLAYVTPSHQFPAGVTMSLARRMDLLEWAARRSAWIVEDDYDSEYRYGGRPLQALQGLDTSGRVIYTGTFSKVLFPALRLGYLVAPEPLVDAFVGARALADRHAPGFEQGVVAEFISGGHFARHIRRMRALYRERQEELVETGRRELGGALEIAPADAGMHLVARLPKNIDDQAASEAAARAGVAAPAISAYSAAHPVPPALMLGYAAFGTRQIREGVRKLCSAMLNLRRTDDKRS